MPNIQGIPGIKTELKPHQMNALNRALENELGLVLAHDVGTGKTLTSLAIANMLGKPADVLVPASLIENYKKEIAKHSTPESVPFNLVSLQRFTRNPEVLQPGNTLIVDEAHRLRNENAKAYKLLEQIPFSKKILMTGTPTYNSPVDLTSLINLIDTNAETWKIHSAGARKYLTRSMDEIIARRLAGYDRITMWSPNYRKLLKMIQGGDLQGILNKIQSYPSLLENFPEYQNVKTVEDFNKKFKMSSPGITETILRKTFPELSSDFRRQRQILSKIIKKLSIEEHKKEVADEITENYTENTRHYIEDHLKPKVQHFVDLYKNENVSDYPEKEEEQVTVGFDSDQEREYNKYFARMPESLRAKILHGEVKNALPSDLSNPFFVKTRLISNMYNKNSPKINKMVEDLKKTNDKTVVYSNFLDEGLKPFAERLDNEGIKYKIFTGEMSQKEKKKAVEDYNSGKINVLLISSAGGEGLDLKGTRLVQIMEPHFNQEKLNQVIGRAVRYQSHSYLDPEDRNVKIKHYITKSPNAPSTEEYLKNMSENKLETNKKIIDLLKKSSLNLHAFLNGFWDNI